LRVNPKKNQTEAIKTKHTSAYNHTRD